MPLALTEIFPGGDHRFHLTLRKGDLAGFFRPINPGVVVAERRRWFENDAARYAAATDEAAPLLSEFEAFARENVGRPPSAPPSNDSMVGRLVKLGGELEPDLVLLANQGAGLFRVCAGAVCFPSWWALTEKLGRTLDEIHGAVPGLNPSLGPTISQFLQKLKPSLAYERSNWGLAATPELNLHPDLARPRLSLPFRPQQTWLRVEDQILAALPLTGGIVFGIRIRLFPLDEILADPVLRAGFRRELQTMPEALVTYKGLAPIHAELLKAIVDTEF